MRVKYLANLYACAGANGACNYGTDATMPVVSSVSISSDNTKLILTGVGFTALVNSGFTPKGKFIDGIASTVNVDSNT